jgi:hypothetical protein
MRACYLKAINIELKNTQVRSYLELSEGPLNDYGEAELSITLSSEHL